MLINVQDDDHFQHYCDQEETRLYKQLWPILAAGTRIQVNTNSVKARAYVEQRGGPILFRHYERIYRDQFNGVSAQTSKADTKAAGASNFLIEQTRNLLAEASRKITQISESLRNTITQLMLDAVSEGKSNNQIAREIREQAPQIGQERAATISRTETHNSALAAIDATLDHKKISIQSKTWWTTQDDRVRPSHADVHGVSIPVDETFDVGDSEMMRPGDQSLGAGAEEVVNCRCSLLYYTSGGDTAGSRAADLYRPPEKPEEQIIEDTGAKAAAAIANVSRKLDRAKLAYTDDPVSEGGFKQPDGQYTPERRAMHQSIVNEMFTPEVIARTRPPAGQQPTLTMLGGRGGSGKSWLTKSKNAPVDEDRAFVMDADIVKAKLGAAAAPRFEGWNAAQLHEESSDVLKLMDDRAAQLGVNVVHDATMKTFKTVEDRMKLYQGKGYAVDGYYMYLSPQAAAGRAMQRFKTKAGDYTGRYVPPSVILSNTNNEKNFDALAKQFRKWAIYDNSGKAPKLVARSREG